MTFKLPKETKVLQFKDTEWEGAEVEVLIDVPLGDFARFLKMDDTTTLMTLPDEYRWVVERGIIVSWNLVDDNNNPIPIEPNCMNRLPRMLAREIMRAWFKAVTEIPPELQKKLDLWRALPGAPDPFNPGVIVSKPVELRVAEIVDSFCQRWGAVPSVVKQESANELFMMIQLLDSDEGE